MPQGGRNVRCPDLQRPFGRYRGFMEAVERGRLAIRHSSLRMSVIQHNNHPTLMAARNTEPSVYLKRSVTSVAHSAKRRQYGDHNNSLPRLSLFFSNRCEPSNFQCFSPNPHRRFPIRPYINIKALTGAFMLNE